MLSTLKRQWWKPQNYYIFNISSSGESGSVLQPCLITSGLLLLASALYLLVPESKDVLLPETIEDAVNMRWGWSSRTYKRSAEYKIKVEIMLSISASSKVRNCAAEQYNAQYNQTNCTAKSHSRALATFQISYPIYVVFTFYWLKRFAVSTYLRNCMRTKNNIYSVQNFLRWHTAFD